MDRFVSLHRHDSYSLFDGVDLSIRAVERAASFEQPAIGLTNHGNIFGIVDHARACETKGGIKPLYGMEAYVTPRAEKPRSRLAHQTIIAQSYEGYRNLMRLVTQSYDHFYYKPRIPFALLEEHGAGLIVLSGCPSSIFQRLLRAGQVEQAERFFVRCKAAFGDRFYAEVQHNEPAQQTARAVVALAQRHGVPLVATNDAHYTDPEDRQVHDLLLRLRRAGQGEESPTYGEGYYVPSREQMYVLLAQAHPWMTAGLVERMLDETVELAARCEVTIPRPERMLPPLWSEARARLRSFAAEGLKRKGLQRKREYVERLAHELTVIEQLGYVEYFHVCVEVTRWARSQGILIGPRGSVCGSLLAYVLEVTMVDPLVHGTLFERFLHAQKRSFPDVDLDIDARHHDRVLAWVIERYAPYAVPIITFGRYGGGNISNDLAKAFPEQIGPGERKRIRQALDRMRDYRIFVAAPEDLEEFTVFDELEHQIEGFKRIVLKLYSMARYVGRHPGGVCFVPGEADRWLATIRYKERTVTSYNFLDVESLGLLKFDFLSMAAIGTISKTLELIEARHEERLALDRIPLGDAEVLEQFAGANTDGIFQFESRGARGILREVEPETFWEVAASTALNRPGVSDNLEKYVANKRRSLSLQRERAVTNSFVATVREVLRETYGVFVYQEQLARLLRALGFEWIETDAFIKSIKSHALSYAASLKEAKGTTLDEKIIAALVERGFPPERAERFVTTIKKYSFNRAHAVGYSLVAYWMMWLRTYYPVEFWTSLLDLEQHENKRLAYESAATWSDCVLLPPHVNGSAGYSIEANAIRVGLATIKGVGEKAASAIVAHGPYHRPRDIKRIPRRQVNRKVLRLLIEAGALEFRDEQLEARMLLYNQNAKESDRSALLWSGGPVSGYAEKKKKR